MSNTLDDLTQDTIVEILARTPVKSLLRFKCVCKSWYSLITSPRFIEIQLRYASSIEDNHSVILKHCVKHSCGIHVSFLSDKKDEVIDLSSVDLPVSVSFFDDIDQVSPDRVFVKFYGPCNGIVCAVGRHISPRAVTRCDRIALWNPSTRAMKRVPPSDVSLRGDDDDVFAGFNIGFGFDLKSNNYKIVRILRFDNLQTLKINRLVEVYDLNTDLWRKIDVSVPEADYLASSIYLDGFYYWWSKANDRDYRLISFDFADEVFATIPPPDINDFKVAILHNFRESLAIFSYYRKSIVVWLLNRNNGENTWDKLFTFTCPKKNIVGFFGNGNVLIRDRVWEEVIGQGFANSNKLKIYDPGSQQFRNTWVCDRIYSPSSVQLVNYVASLVSFPGATEL